VAINFFGIFVHGKSAFCTSFGTPDVRWAVGGRDGHPLGDLRTVQIFPSYPSGGWMLTSRETPVAVMADSDRGARTIRTEGNEEEFCGVSVCRLH
jgi:hypothetical protein